MALLEHIKALEKSLHHTDTRKNSEQFTHLLHEDFREFGRSGTRYDKVAIVQQMATETFENLRVWAQDFHLTQLAENVVLLTYRSALQTPDGQLSHHANRSSLWQSEGGKWSLRFHQGTPTSPFNKNP